MSSIINGYFQLVKKILPSQAEDFSVGLDISASECKMVQICSSSDGYSIVNWAVEPIVGGDIGKTVQMVLERLEGSQFSIYTSIFGKGTLIRYIDLPRMSLKDLKSSFGIEVDKYFPFAQDQTYTDCFILDPKGTEKQMSVMAAAAKKELVDDRLKIFEDIGVDIDFMGINTIGLSNIIHALGYIGEEASDECIALLDMGESMSSLTIIKDKLPRFTRDIYIGGQDLTKRISNIVDISFEEAEKLKADPGDKRAEVIECCETTVMNIVQELRLSFDYFSSEKSLSINKFLLTGGASMLEGLSEVFEKYLEVKTLRWKPMDSFQISDNLDEEGTRKKSLKLGVALGLGLYHYD